MDGFSEPLSLETGRWIYGERMYYLCSLVPDKICLTLGTRVNRGLQTLGTIPHGEKVRAATVQFSARL